MRRPGKLALLMAVLGLTACGTPIGDSIVGGDSSPSGPTGLWLRVSREPQPPTVTVLRSMLEEDLGEVGTAGVDAAWQRTTGTDVFRLAQTRVDAECAHFLNRLRAAQAGSRFTSIGISTTNALTLGIMGATAAAAPGVAIAGASIAAANALISGFDETVLMTQHADRIAALVAAEHLRIRAGALANQELAAATIGGRAAGVAEGIKYARACNYSGIRRLLDQAITAGTIRAQSEATASLVDAQTLNAVLVGISTLMGGETISIESAALIRLGMATRARLQALPDPLERAVEASLARPGDRARLEQYFLQAERSAAFRAAVDALR